DHVPAAAEAEPLQGVLQRIRAGPAEAGADDLQRHAPPLSVDPRGPCPDRRPVWRQPPPPRRGNGHCERGRRRNGRLARRGREWRPKMLLLILIILLLLALAGGGWGY